MKILFACSLLCSLTLSIEADAQPIARSSLRAHVPAARLASDSTRVVLLSEDAIATKDHQLSWRWVAIGSAAGAIVGGVAGWNIDAFGCDVRKPGSTCDVSANQRRLALATGASGALLGATFGGISSLLWHRSSNSRNAK